MSLIPYTSGNFPEYRFYITVTTLTYEVFPLNFVTSQLEDKLEGDNVFYRRKFVGTLLFGTNSKVLDDTGTEQNRMDDWLFFWGIEQTTPCEKLYLTITKTVEGVPSTYWEGYFSTTDGKIDIDKCTFEVKPLSLDDYTDIMDKVDLQYNILTVATVVTTTAYVAGVIDTTFTRNRWLVEVIEYLADNLIAGVNVSSDFFTAATNPATGNDNHLLYLTIAQKSDIIRPTSSDPSTIALLSWNELMDILWAMFQVRWEYDGVDTINVEHISWFTGGVGIDLRSQLMTVATNKYSYIKESMPKYERFSFMEALDNNFIGVPIWYDSPCVDQDPSTNVKELSINVTTDIEQIVNYPEAISDDGFVILCNYQDGADYFVAPQLGVLTATIKLNNHLSWANLHHYYFRDHRVLIEGYLNDTLTTFWTAIKTKKQVCSAIICEDYDPSDEITTELGETYFDGAKAKVDVSRLNPSGQISFDLLYGPADNENTGVPDNDDKIINIDLELNCVTFWAVLSQTAAGILAIQIQCEIHNPDTTVFCTGAWEAWNIPAGVFSDSFNPTYCGAIPAGGYVLWNIDTSAIPTWTVNFDYDPFCAGA